MLYILLSIVLAFVNGCKENKSNNDMKSGSADQDKILMIIAPVNFRDEELKIPHDIFEKSGFSVEVASKEVKECHGMLGMVITPDLSLKDINVKQYKAVIFVGGSGAEVYFNDTMVINIAKKAYEEKKTIGAICLAPVILANAGLLENREATVWKGAKDLIIEKGAKYQGDKVVIDGNIITAPGPHKAKEFAEEIVRILKD